MPPAAIDTHPVTCPLALMPYARVPGPRSISAFWPDCAYVGPQRRAKTVTAKTVSCARRIPAFASGWIGLNLARPPFVPLTPPAHSVRVPQIPLERLESGLFAHRIEDRSVFRYRSPAPTPSEHIHRKGGRSRK